LSSVTISKTLVEHRRRQQVSNRIFRLEVCAMNSSASLASVSWTRDECTSSTTIRRSEYVSRTARLFILADDASALAVDSV
jgi:hypothetical protein